MRNSTGRPSRPWWLRLLGVSVLLCCLHPRLWDAAATPLWAPWLGLGVALTAWFGPRFATAALALAGGLFVVRSSWRLLAVPDLAATCSLLLDTALLATPLLFWWLYHQRAGGRRALADPRSAILFVATTAVVATGIALVRVLLTMALDARVPAGWAELLARHALADALGVMVVAPALLVLLTPWLSRAGMLVPEIQTGHAWHQRLLRGDYFPATGPARWGDWLEITGLSLGAGLLGLMLGGVPGQRELLGWQLWGVLVLLIVWASLRQGLRGGTLVAACAAVVPLLVPGRLPEDATFRLLLQAHLLAGCGTALLISSAVAWVRLSESGYQQIVSHIPVVIYSARLSQPRPRSEAIAPRPADTIHAEMLSDTWRQGGESGGPLPLPPAPAVHAAEITLVSAASAGMFGCVPEELVGDYHRWLARVHPEDREVLAAALEQLTRQEQPVTCEYRLADPGLPPSSKRGMLPSSKVRWLRDTLAPHRDTDGRLLGWEGVVIDITEQRALADDLRRTTSMFNALVANLPTGVFFVQGPHGHPILVNARARQLLGQREDAAAGLEHLSRSYRLFRPDGTLYPAEELPVYMALKQGRTTMRDDIIVHRPDGRRVPLVTWAAPVQLGSGRGPSQSAAVWVLEDLTALHQAEAARKDSEGRLRAIVETMGEGLIVLDQRGAVVNSNPAAATLLGGRAEQMRGRTLAELGWNYVSEDGSALSVEDHPASVALRTGRAVRNVLLGVGSTGVPVGLGTRWLLVNAMPLAVDGGAAAGVVATFADLSAYVQARESIRISEERYRTLVESLPIMLAQTDRDLRLMYINPATTQISGYTLDELAEPGAWSSFISPDDLPRVVTALRGAVAGRAERLEYRYQAKDGSEKVGFLITQPRYQAGVVCGTSILIVDVTRERQLERELQRSQRLELIGRVSSGVAHDFNNLLGVVLSLTDLARKHLPADHPAASDLNRISDAGEQAANLAGQLLALGKQRPGNVRRVEVNQAVTRTLDLLRATLPATIRVELDLDSRDVFIRADETHVQQVLMNLCLNARDAMPTGGVMLVRTRNPNAERPEVSLVVADTGAGMDPEVQARIFEPFYSTKEGGSGLGLAIVQQIIDSGGGRIDVESTPGVGTRFTTHWPAMPEA